MIRIEALLTCHDRRELTLAALEALFAQHLPPETTLHATLCDDGCSDGTAAAVAERFASRVSIADGDGGLYWNRGMLRAWDAALAAGTPDHILWLNDDVRLDHDAVARLLRVGGGAVATGATRDPADGSPTYGGFARGARLRLAPVAPAAGPQRVDTCNGNCVLIPASAAAVVGRLDPRFHHGLGDLDFGLRCTASGVPVVQVAGTVGTCRRNGWRGTWRDPGLPRRERWRRVRSPTGLPPREWLRFCWRHAGAPGLAVWAWTYARIWLGLPGPRT